MTGNLDFGYLLLQTLSLNLGLSIMPYRLSERPFLVWCSIYGFIIATAYQTGITSVFTSVHKPHNPETVREVIDMGRTGFAMLPSTRRFLSEPDKDYQFILNHSIECKSVVSCIQYGLGSGNYCVLANYHFVNYMARASFLDENGDKLYYELKNVFLPFYSEVLMQKNHILIEPYNYYIGKLLAGGLLQKWVRDLQLLPKRIQTRISINLRLKDFAGPFTVLLIGLCVALIVFIVEICVTLFIFIIKNFVFL